MSDRSFCSTSSGCSRLSFGENPPTSSEAYLGLSRPVAVFESFEQTQPKANNQSPVSIFFDHVLNQVIFNVWFPFSSLPCLNFSFHSEERVLLYFLSSPKFLENCRKTILKYCKLMFWLLKLEIEKEQ